MRLRLSLTGNPNCGKTTLYNTLTGEEEYVGNWSGVTVAAAEVEMRTQFGDATIVDLPGTYSISAYSSEESLTLSYINKDRSDVIVNIVDITNLSRSLFFTTQLLQLGIPMMVALNKSDILQDTIDTKILAQELGCPVIAISAQNGDCLEAMVTLAATAYKPRIQKDYANDQARFDHIEEILSKVYVTKVDRAEITTADKVDRILTSRLLGLPLFLSMMWTIFSFSQTVVRYFSSIISDTIFDTWISGIFHGVFDAIHLNPLLQALVVDAMLGGVGTVLGFVPLIACLFFLLALLEDCGYLARVTVVMDTFFKKIGLSGRAIIPMTVGTGCSVPGILATRTIENDNQRKRLCILTPFIPCGRKMPLMALFASLFFQDSSWFYPFLYALTIGILFTVGYLLKKVFTIGHEDSIFIMELPPYRLPRLDFARQQMWKKTCQFVKRAMTIILLCNTVIFLLQHYDFTLHRTEIPEESMLAVVGSFLSVIFIPLGLGSWQQVTATLTGFVAKENAIATLSVIYLSSGGDFFDIVEGNPLLEAFTPESALSFLLFQLYSPPCFAAIATMHGEMRDKGWMLLGLGTQLAVGYGVAFIAFQLATFLATGAFGSGVLWGCGVMVLLCFALLIGKSYLEHHVEEVTVRH